MRLARGPRHASLVFTALLLAAPLGAQDKKTPDLTGRWQFTVQSEVGTGTPTVTFRQKGDTLTGRYSSQALGERDFTGTFKDGKIEFSFGAESGGQAFTMSFSGKLDSDDAMSGTIDFSGFATGTFTGKRVKQGGD
jgi:hypothetical protein